MRRVVWFVVCGILSVQIGGAIAKGLFDRIDPTGMVLLRLAASAVMLLLITRPRLRGRSRRDWYAVIGLGLSMGTMNWAIYQSFSRIPLGLAVTIEFIGPLSIAVLGSRRLKDLAWVLLAAVGVVILGFAPHGITLAGVAFALIAGAAWASYILMSASTGRRWEGLDGLAVASMVATIALSPYLFTSGASDLATTGVLLTGAAVGLLSSVIPYSLEMIALRSIKPSVFGILMSLEPAAAALAAMVILGEFLAPLQWLAVACVIAASVGATRSGPQHAEPVRD
ncbi:MAG: EamA family transporter [Nocardioides sp.]|nr:EamA family transporter [Nocardioides sp.]